MKRNDVLIVLFLGVQSFMQAQSVVKQVPEEANGYLILDRLDYTNLDRWECDVWRHAADADGNQNTTKVLSLHTDKDYFFLPEIMADYDLSDGVYLMDIRGVDNRGNQLFEERGISPLLAPIYPDDILAPHGPLPDLKCRKNCNGKVYSGHLFPYAYAIGLFEYEIGGSFLQVISARYPDANGDPQPFYAYYEAANFYSWCTVPECVDNTGTKIIHGIDGSSGNYTDIQGHVLSGTLVAVRKDPEPWHGLRAPEIPSTTSPIHHRTFTFGDEKCSNPFSWFLNMVNDHGDFSGAYTSSGFPYPLECIPAQGAFSPGGGLPHSWTLAWLEDRNNELMELIPCFDCPENPGGSMPPPAPAPIENAWSILRAMEDEAELNQIGAVEISGLGEGPGGIDPNIGQWIDRLIITDLLGSSGTTIIDLKNLYASDGSLRAPSITLPAGLYSLAAVYTNGELRTKVVEAVTGIDATYQLAEMIDIEVTPSPIGEDNSFTIHFDARFRGSVSYTLLDINGIPLHTDTYSFKKDDPASQFVQLDQSIPPGIVFHRFEFPDESVITIESMKK